MNQNYPGATQAEKPREANLNERLNMLSERLKTQCDRIESVLARVNGTPPIPIGSAGRGENKTAMPTLPLATVVEHLEAVQARLLELTDGVERIA